MYTFDKSSPETQKPAASPNREMRRAFAIRAKHFVLRDQTGFPRIHGTNRGGPPTRRGSRDR